MYGPQSYDVRVLFNAGLVYHLPFYKSQHGWQGRLLGGWGIAPLFTAQSGFPQQVDTNGDCQSFGESSCSNTTNENAILIGSIPGMSSHYGVSSSGARTARHQPTPTNPNNKGVGLKSFGDPASGYRQFRRAVL